MSKTVVSSLIVGINGESVTIPNGSQIFFKNGSIAVAFLNTKNGNIFSGDNDWGSLKDIDGIYRTVEKIIVPSSNRGYGTIDYDGKIIYEHKEKMIRVGKKEYSESTLKLMIKQYSE